MPLQKRYEVLNGLPTYGPMYIPISESGEKFYSEGFVVRFHKKNGTDWVANFKQGFSEYCNVFQLSVGNKIIVIANGQGYIMSSEQQTPLDTFGLAITEVLKTDNEILVAADQTDLIIINNQGSIWRTARISWDGLKDIILEGNLVSGLSYDPMNEAEEWVKFSINLDTREIKGGSYRKYYEDNRMAKNKPF